VIGMGTHLYIKGRGTHLYYRESLCGQEECPRIGSLLERGMSPNRVSVGKRNANSKLCFFCFFVY